MSDSQDIPHGLCQCGCGARTTIAKHTRPGRKRGMPTRFVAGHYLRSGSPVRQGVRSRDPEDIAWAAGLFEGEGCFLSSTRKGRYRYASACLNMTDEDIIERFYRVVGVGTVIGPFQRGTNKPKWEWKAQRHQDVEEVALLFEPWLGPRRLVQAASALATDTRRESV